MVSVWPSYDLVTSEFFRQKCFSFVSWYEGPFSGVRERLSRPTCFLFSKIMGDNLILACATDSVKSCLL